MTFNEYILLFGLYFLIGAIISIRYWKSIWKGICGGNGIPQTDELVKAIALKIIWFEFALITFFNKEIDIEYLIFLLAMLGISAVSTYSNKKIKSNETKSNG